MNNSDEAMMQPNAILIPAATHTDRQNATGPGGPRTATNISLQSGGTGSSLSPPKSLTDASSLFAPVITSTTGGSSSFLKLREEQEKRIAALEHARRTVFEEELPDYSKRIQGMGQRLAGPEYQLKEATSPHSRSENEENEKKNAAVNEQNTLGMENQQSIPVSQQGGAELSSIKKLKEEVNFSSPLGHYAHVASSGSPIKPGEGEKEAERQYQDAVLAVQRQKRGGNVSSSSMYPIRGQQVEGLADTSATIIEGAWQQQLLARNAFGLLSENERDAMQSQFFHPSPSSITTRKGEVRLGNKNKQQPFSQIYSGASFSDPISKGQQGRKKKHNVGIANNSGGDYRRIRFDHHHQYHIDDGEEEDKNRENNYEQKLAMEEKLQLFLAARQIPAPKEVEILSREVDRLMVYIHLTAKQREEDIAKKVRDKEEEFLLKLHENYRRQEELQRSWDLEKLNFQNEREGYLAQIQRMELRMDEANHLEHELGKLKTEKSEVEKGFVTLAKERDAHWEHVVSQLRKENSELETENDQLISTVKVLEAELSKLAKLQTEEENLILRSDIYQKQKIEIESLRKENAEFKQKLKQKENVNKALLQQVDVGHRSYADCHAKFDSQSQAILKTYEAKFSEQNEILAQYKKQNGELSEEVQKLVRRNSDMAAQLEVNQAVSRQKHVSQAQKVLDRL